MAKDFARKGPGHGLLPREIASPAAFDNAMILDMAMGGSTNTVLHILAIAHEAEVPFTMQRIDELSQKTPNICKVSPASRYHIEDVARAGGIHTILGEVARGCPGLLDGSCMTVSGKTLAENIADYDVRARIGRGGGPAAGQGSSRRGTLGPCVERPERLERVSGDGSGRPRIRREKRSAVATRSTRTT